MIPEFINRKQGKTKVTYELPQLEPILKETYGVCVYQEQVMQIASAVADFSMGEADILRRAMGKKDAQMMAQQREKFVKGAIAKGVKKEKAEKLFDLLAAEEQAHKTGVKLVFPLVLCIFPGLLVILLAPGIGASVEMAETRLL